MDCILIRPPFEHTGFDQDCQESLGTGYLLAALRQRGFSAGIIDGELQELTPDEIADIVLQLNPIVVGFSIVSEYVVDSASHIAATIKSRAACRPHITSGGYLPSFFPEVIFRLIPDLDSVIQFEGEMVLPQLVLNTIDGRPFDTQGITVLGEGGIHRTNPVDVIHSLDNLPFPHRDMLPKILEMGLPVTISGSRGCSGGCSFCSITGFNYLSCGIPLRMRSAENIFSEIDSLYRIHSADVFHFIDDDFIGNINQGLKKAEKLADLIIQADYKIVFSFECRPDHVERNLFAKLKNAGLAGVFIGIDSAVERTRKLYNKNCSMETVNESIEILRDLGLDLDTGFIPFHPDVTFEEIKDEYNFLFSHELDNLHTLLNRLYCTGESILSKRMIKQGILRNCSDFELSYDFTDSRVSLFYEIASTSLKPLFPLWYDIYKKRQKMRDQFLLGKETEKLFRLSDSSLRKSNSAVRNCVIKIIEYAGNESQGDLLLFARTVRNDLKKEIMGIKP